MSGSVFRNPQMKSVTSDTGATKATDGTSTSSTTGGRNISINDLDPELFNIINNLKTGTDSGYELNVTGGDNSINIGDTSTSFGTGNIDASTLAFLNAYVEGGESGSFIPSVQFKAAWSGEQTYETPEDKYAEDIPSFLFTAKWYRHFNSNSDLNTEELDFDDILCQSKVTSTETTGNGSFIDVVYITYSDLQPADFPVYVARKQDLIDNRNIARDAPDLLQDAKEVNTDEGVFPAQHKSFQWVKNTTQDIFGSQIGPSDIRYNEGMAGVTIPLPDIIDPADKLHPDGRRQFHIEAMSRPERYPKGWHGEGQDDELYHSHHMNDFFVKTINDFGNSGDDTDYHYYGKSTIFNDIPNDLVKAYFHVDKYIIAESGLSVYYPNVTLENYSPYTASGTVKVTFFEMAEDEDTDEEANKGNESSGESVPSDSNTDDSSDESTDTSTATSE